MLTRLALIFVITFTACQENKNKNEHHHEQHDEVYTCSMHPEVNMDEPGICPICKMDLILKTEPKQILQSTDQKGHQGVFTEVVDSTMVIEDQLYGKIVWNESLQSKESMWFPGQIKKWMIRHQGQRIKQGQLIAMIYSEKVEKILLDIELMTDDNLKKKRRELLMKWGLNQSTISKALTHPKKWVEIRSGSSGVVSSIYAQKGEFVNTGEALIQLENPHKYWLELSLNEIEFQNYSIGDSLFVSLTGVKPFHVQLDWFDSEVNKGQLKAYAKIKKHIEGLKSGLRAKVAHQRKIKGLLIPKSSYLMRHQDAIVYVKKAKGSMNNSTETREVIRQVIELGRSNSKWVEVKSGLAQGDQVLSQGLFRYDASQQLEGSEMKGHH